MKLRNFIIMGIILTGLSSFGTKTLAANIITDNPITQAAKNPIKFTPEIPIPGLFDKTQDITNSSIGTYIKAIYIYFIWIVGVMSVVMITYGGIRWIAAAGNAARINDARETINNAIIGLIIALTSYTLLNIINPAFLTLKPISPEVQTNRQLVFKNGCIQNLKCPTDYQQTEGAHCSGGSFGAISGSFLYANPGDNYCGSTGSTQYGICCSDVATHQNCVGVSSVDGSLVSGTCNQNVSLAKNYTACADQTPCGVLKSINSTQSCIGVKTPSPDNVCYVLTNAQGDPTGSGVQLPGGSAGGSYVFSGVSQCVAASKPSFKMYFDATIDCGTYHTGNTADGLLPIWGTQQNCPNGQYCGLEPFGNACELIGPRTGCILNAIDPRT